MAGLFYGQRIVVKIGSSTITNSVSSINSEWLASFAEQIAFISSEGAEVVIVSSGAIACGLGRLGMKERPSDIPTLQACASVGEAALVTAYEEAFAPHRITPSIVLLTRRDTADREAYVHARSTFSRLLSLGVVPIVNENDTVSVEQIKFGDNDTLAALVACLVDATLVVILSDIQGLYDANPHDNPQAQLVPQVNKINQQVLASAGGPGSTAGSGGMVTKITAARVLMAAGIPMAIVSGKAQNSLVDTVQGNCPGTLFVSDDVPHEITPRKLWVALGDTPRGSLVVDNGAECALVKKGASLLPVGVSSVQGTFDTGDIVDVCSLDGHLIARGVVSASSDAVSLACGKTREELQRNSLLSYLADKPVVHRDDLVLFD